MKEEETLFIPAIVIGTKDISFSHTTSTEGKQVIVFIKTSPTDYKQGKHFCDKTIKQEDALFCISFTNKGSINRLITYLEEIKENLKYEEIEDWEKDNEKDKD